MQGVFQSVNNFSLWLDDSTALGTSSQSAKEAGANRTYEKTRLRGSDLETWCPEEDSNLHGVAPAST
jgi:hypothetical protein